MGAGNSFDRWCFLCFFPVYPRGCGELRLSSTSERYQTGLSPWVRGTLVVDEAHLSLGRFIPVGAGNSHAEEVLSYLPAVYPRGCGELTLMDSTVPSLRGLSPWVRGTPMLPISGSRIIRFIPVGAGNSLLHSFTSIPLTVYPRGCGELPTCRRPTSCNSGLSPWVRGTPHHGVIVTVRHRFIPVGAGNSCEINALRYTTTVYPRGCGELVEGLPVTGSGVGLSPWVRGTHQVASVTAGQERFIPVGAGNSYCHRTHRSGRAVYPRGCGELSRLGVHSSSISGLSPWVRGTLR